MFVKQYLASSLRDFFPNEDVENISAPVEKLKKLAQRLTELSANSLYNDSFLDAAFAIDSVHFWSNIEQNILNECKALSDKLIRANVNDPSLILDFEWQINLSEAWLLGKVSTTYSYLCFSC